MTGPTGIGSADSAHPIPVPSQAVPTLWLFMSDPPKEPAHPDPTHTEVRLLTDNDRRFLQWLAHAAIQRYLSEQTKDGTAS